MPQPLSVRIRLLLHMGMVRVSLQETNVSQSNVLLSDGNIVRVACACVRACVFYARQGFSDDRIRLG